MEIFSILLGMIFWPTVIMLWLLICRKTKSRMATRIVGTAVILVLPTLAAFSMGWWMFVQEPLFSAAGEGDIAKVKSLIAMGAKVDIESEGSPTALGFAAGNGHIDVVRLLIGYGADVNRASSVGGKTPLSMAKAGGHPEIVALLQKAGARQ